MLDPFHENLDLLPVVSCELNATRYHAGEVLPSHFEVDNPPVPVVTSDSNSNPGGDNILTHFYDFFDQDEGDTRAVAAPLQDSESSVVKLEPESSTADFEMHQGSSVAASIRDDTSSVEKFGHGSAAADFEMHPGSSEHVDVSPDIGDEPEAPLWIDKPNVPPASQTLQPAVLSESSTSPLHMHHSSISHPYTTKPSAEQINPRKRSRSHFDAVEIIVPQWLERRRCRIKQEQENEFLNPTWKIKRRQEDVKAGLDPVFRRIDALQVKPLPLNVDDALLYFTVSREFISDIYGGNCQSTFPSISPEKSHHGYNDFMFLNITYNPYAPQRPGFPGLFYRSRTTDLPKFHRVFIRIMGATWLYLGQYELVQADPLTAQEWMESSKQTKEMWCKHICIRNWGADIRARIALRKALGREPTIEETTTGMLDGSGSGVTPEDVKSALDNGEEAVNVWVMKCVAYDDTFQRETMEKFSTWKPKEKTKPKAKGATGQGPVKAEASVKDKGLRGASGKGKRQAIDTRALVERVPSSSRVVESPRATGSGSAEGIASSRITRERRVPKRFLSD